MEVRWGGGNRGVCCSIVSDNFLQYPVEKNKGWKNIADFRLGEGECIYMKAIRVQHKGNELLEFGV